MKMSRMKLEPLFRGFEINVIIPLITETSCKLYCMRCLRVSVGVD